MKVWVLAWLLRHRLPGTVEIILAQGLHCLTCTARHSVLILSLGLFLNTNPCLWFWIWHPKKKRRTTSREVTLLKIWLCESNSRRPNTLSKQTEWRAPCQHSSRLCPLGRTAPKISGTLTGIQQQVVGWGGWGMWVWCLELKVLECLALVGWHY